jgi:hypothetical protein
MLRSMGTKGGTILYHIGYGTTLGCLVINGVIGCYRSRCWLTSVRLITKPGCGQICCMGTPTCVIGMLGTIGYRAILSSSFVNRFNLSSTKGQSLNSHPTCWQYAHVDVLGCITIPTSLKVDCVPILNPLQLVSKYYPTTNVDWVGIIILGM